MLPDLLDMGHAMRDKKALHIHPSRLSPSAPDPGLYTLAEYECPVKVGQARPPAPAHRLSCAVKRAAGCVHRTITRTARPSHLRSVTMIAAATPGMPSIARRRSIMTPPPP